jgi:hypothetical protein
MGEWSSASIGSSFASGAVSVTVCARCVLPALRGRLVDCAAAAVSSKATAVESVNRRRFAGSASELLSSESADGAKRTRAGDGCALLAACA